MKEIARRIIDNKQENRTFVSQEILVCNGENGKEYIVRSFRKGKYDPT